MKSGNHRRQSGRHPPCQFIRGSCGRTRNYNQAQSDVIKENRITDMKNQICPMITKGIRPPNTVVERQSQPSKWLVLTELKVTEYPLKFVPAEPPIVEILRERSIIQVDKAGLQHWKKCRRSNQHNERGKHMPCSRPASLI